MKIVAKTDIGKKRSTNQDSYVTGELPGSVAWAVVCDGMGGAAGGSVASSTAVKVISEKINSAYRTGMSPKSIKNMIMTAITAANISIFDMSKANKELEGMGTTVVCCVVADGVAYIAHAGDSRAYSIKGDTVAQLTKDHSVVQELLDRGEIEENEAVVHPLKNVITKAVGVPEKTEGDVDTLDLLPDDIILICSDGLSTYVPAESIAETLSLYGVGEECCDQLIELANGVGGKDNVTVVLYGKEN